MTYRVEIASRARRDLRLIFRAIHAADSEAAGRWFNGLENGILSLAECPERCPEAPETVDASTVIRQFLYGHKPHIYRVLYTVDQDRATVSVLHVRHGARRPASGL